MKAINYLALAAMAISLAACSNNEDEPTGNGSEPVAAKIIGNINGVNTRAYDNQWESGDQIGISATSDGETEYTNMQYSTTGNGSFEYVGDAENGIFFQDTENVTFSAYYPFESTVNTSTREISRSTEVQAEQNQNQNQNQRTFDFLFASAKVKLPSATVNFTFYHKMTRLVLNITAGKKITADNVEKGTYYLSGIKHSGTFNTEDGTAAATGNATDDWKINATATGTTTRTYSMIFYPQTNATLTFKAEIGGKTYSCPLTPELNAGFSYPYNITVNKTGLTVSDCEIENWNNVDPPKDVPAEMK